jgi:crotonobetainyl-CoA:carnitine CoA-transferase CaiB-like acyl-CoA transferase
MGVPELADDPRFADHRARGDRQAELDGLIAGWTQGRTSAEVLAPLHEAGVPAGLVYEPGDMLADPHFRARDSIARVPDDQFGEVAMPAVAPRLSATPGSIRTRAPRLGEHTDAVLTQELGLGPRELAELRAAGVI